jgi:hypothetical protein
LGGKIKVYTNRIFIQIRIPNAFFSNINYGLAKKKKSTTSGCFEQAPFFLFIKKKETTHPQQHNTIRFKSSFGRAQFGPLFETNNNLQAKKGGGGPPLPEVVSRELFTTRRQ